MTDADGNKQHERRPLRLENPTLLGKVVGLGTTAVKLVGSGVDLLLNTVTDIVLEAEKAFKDGLDPNIEDAKIIDEHERQDPGRSGKQAES